MRFLLRKIAISLRRLSFLPVGYNRTLNLWSLLSVRRSLYRVLVVSVASSLGLAIFGIGLHRVISEFLSEDMVTGTITKTIVSSVLASSLWIFMVSMNHIHDITGLWSDISHYYELIWWVPAYISVSLIGPVFNIFYWCWISIFNGIPYPITELTVFRELSDFIVMTVPAFSSYIWENICDFVSQIITWDDIREVGNLVYNGIVYSIATVIYHFSPYWVQDTRIGRWAVITASSTILMVAIWRIIIRLFWGW